MAIPTRPEGYHSVTPYLVCDGAAQAIEFYARAFGATELFRLPMGDKVGHAEIMIGDSHVMLSDEWPDMNLRGPKSRGGPTASLMVYVDDVDAMFERAVTAGATVERDVENQFWGDRTGTRGRSVRSPLDARDPRRGSAARGNGAPHGRVEQAGGVGRPRWPRAARHRQREQRPRPCRTQPNGSIGVNAPRPVSL